MFPYTAFFLHSLNKHFKLISSPLLCAVAFLTVLKEILINAKPLAYNCSVVKHNSSFWRRTIEVFV